jgi:hypothetical protein
MMDTVTLYTGLRVNVVRVERVAGMLQLAMGAPA